MSNAKRNPVANIVNQNDVRDTSNPVVFPTHETMNTTSTQTIMLKTILINHKIKTDPKLIRRVLRKYYAQKINHQHRDAWVFPTSHVDAIVKLIDTHCRAGQSAK
jgi:hypothetical protein